MGRVMKTDNTATRRIFLASASAMAGTAVVEGAIFRPMAFAATRMSDAEKWTHAMAALGPRITGGEAHRKWIAYLADRLSEMGLHATRYPVPVRYWEATAWSLEATDHLG